MSVITTEPTMRAASTWRRAYGLRLAATDAALVVIAVAVAHVARFRLGPAEVRLFSWDHNLDISYGVVSVSLIVLWMLSLGMFGTRDPRMIGAGSTEYKRVIGASIRLFGLVAIAAYLLDFGLARRYVLVAFPLGTVLLIGGRWLWRQWLLRQRRAGRFSARVLLVGSLESVVSIARDLDRVAAAGYRVVAACVPGVDLARLPGTTIPVYHDVEAIPASMEAAGADTVIVTSSGDLPPERIRQLSWSLEPGRQHLVVAPSLTDVGGPRIHMRPVAGLPLIHVETPRYEGFKRFSKRAFDILASGLLIVVLSPFLALTAMAVRLSTPGPVLFRQQRVGLNGDPFLMLKFRSMVVDAEERLSDLSDRARSEGNTVMFKMKDDPRVTPIGAFLRRFSLDELPQLFNVFGGSMSLVGPRPPLEREVAVYERHVHRRFLVKPGITGLWQVSGRSNLSWEDTVRLDLYYVENWSLTGDLVILWRTARAVVGKDGAY